MGAIAQPPELPRWASLLAWSTIAGDWVDVGERYVNGGNIYEVVIAGTTAASGGPSGTGSLIEDGSAYWQYIGANAGTWTTGTDYAVGNRVTSSGNIYQVLVAGSGESTVAPTGTGTITTSDGYTWIYIAQATAVSTEPSNGQKDVGWLPGQQPTAQGDNWWKWTVYRWLQWIRDVFSTFTDGLLGVKRMAHVPDLITLSWLMPTVASWIQGTDYSEYALVLDPYGNVWQDTTSGTHAASATTWASSGIYPGKTNTTDGTITWTCVALAGSTPAASAYNPSGSYAQYALVVDPVLGLIWQNGTAGTHTPGGSPSWPTSGLALWNGSAGTQVIDGSITWNLVGFGALQVEGVNDGDLYWVPGLGLYRYVAAGTGRLADSSVDTTQVGWSLVNSALPDAVAQWEAVGTPNTVLAAGAASGVQRVRQYTDTNTNGPSYLSNHHEAMDGNLVLIQNVGLYQWHANRNVTPATNYVVNDDGGGSANGQYVLVAVGYDLVDVPHGIQGLDGNGYLLLPTTAAKPAFTPTAFTSGMMGSDWTSASLVYWRDAAGIVHIEGNATFGTGAGTTVFTMPAGFRPAGQPCFLCMDFSNFGGANSVYQVNVANNGVATLSSVSGMSNGDSINFEISYLAAN